MTDVPQIQNLPGVTHPTCRVAVFLGSGGHTSEMLQMMKGLDLERYEPRLYIVSEGDQFSAGKAAEFETGSSFPEVLEDIEPVTITK
ncbi:UDP-N-acetylglucosamine transferase subunit [Serendipita sp. 400]|nr:UDP-N-acetylglucosamine transferase subunit [Serendipita sp. 400]